MKNVNAIEKDYIDLLKKSLMGCLSDLSFNEVGYSKNTGLKKIANWFFLKLLPKSLMIVRISNGSPDTRKNRSDSSFGSFTMVGHKRLDFLEDAIRKIVQEGIDGDLLEAGVWRGGSAIFMKKMLDILGEKRNLYCADSFEGMPKPKLEQDLYSDKGDLSSVKYYSVNVEKVRANFEQFNALDQSVHFIKGWFSKTLPKLPVSKLALLRVDCDLYESTMDVLKNLYDKVQDQGFVYIDDYYNWGSCRKAVEDFRETEGVKGALVRVDFDSVYWRK